MSEKLKVKTYCINRGQPAQYYGLKTAKENTVLHSAPNNWKTERGRMAGQKSTGTRCRSRLKKRRKQNRRQKESRRKRNKSSEVFGRQKEIREIREEEANERRYDNFGNVFVVAGCIDGVSESRI